MSGQMEKGFGNRLCEEQEHGKKCEREHGKKCEGHGKKCEQEYGGKYEQEHEREMDINKRLIINMRDLNHVMRALYEGKASQKRILIMLDEVKSITQRDLTMRLGIQPGSASEILSKLENAGFILRTMSETDRRTANILLTEKGTQAAQEAAEQRSRRHVEMFSCLEESEKTELLALLEKLNADWTKRYGAAAAERRGRHHHCGRDCERENEEGHGCGHGHEGRHGHELEDGHGHESEIGFRHRDEYPGHFMGEGSENAHHHGQKHGHHHEESPHHEDGYRYEHQAHRIETEEPGHVEIH